MRTDDKSLTDSWIGRDCNKFVKEAHLHLGYLLHLAYLPEEAGPKARAVLDAAAEEVQQAPDADAGADDDDDDDEYDDEPTDAEVAAEEARHPKMMTAAGGWDAFLALDYEMRPFSDDSDAYRESRAVDYFNAEVRVKREALNEYAVGERSWLSHAGMCVMPRQMVANGDPFAKGCDAAEAFAQKCST